MNKTNGQWLIVALFFSFVLILAFASVPRSHGQECISIVAENDGSDNRFVQLQLSNAEGCVAIYGLYVQIEKDGSIHEITSTPSGWTYGMVENEAASWTTETDPINSNSKIFGMEMQTSKPHILHWFAVDQTWSLIAEGTLIIG